MSGLCVGGGTVVEARGSVIVLDCMDDNYRLALAGGAVVMGSDTRKGGGMEKRCDRVGCAKTKEER